VNEEGTRKLAVAATRGGEVARLCGSLQVDVAQTRSLLGWMPPVLVDDELARTASWNLEHISSERPARP
jgi:hypothetical protein